MRVLLLEDDVETREQVAGLLRGVGHEVDVVADGLDAVSRGRRGDHDVLVLDRMVPGVDGLAALRTLRAGGVSAPALFLTARGEVPDRLEGFEAGGDDYLVKPFSGPELLARVAALARRATMSAAPTRLRVGDLEIDQLSRRVVRAGRPIDLQPQEYRLLEQLARHAGETLTRRMLLRDVWDFEFDPGTNIVESHVSRLRGKVDRGFDREMIVTVRGVGYRLEPDA